MSLPDEGAKWDPTSVHVEVPQLLLSFAFSVQVEAPRLRLRVQRSSGCSRLKLRVERSSGGSQLKLRVQR